jgi:hypothetical protein
MARTLQEAQDGYNTWLAAETAIASGQTYHIGRTRLERADLPQVHKMVLYFSREIDRLSTPSRSMARVIQIIPRDL